MVILADFILEFRFEFLWPFWLLLRSVYDSFKYQGLVSVVTQLPISCNLTLSHTCQNLTIPFLSLSLSGLLCIFYLYCTYVRHDLLLFYPCALAVFCCQHLCLGAIRLAHRYVENKFISDMDKYIMYICRNMIPHTDTVHNILVGTKIYRGILTFNQYKSLIKRFIFFIQIKECVYQL